MEYNRFQYLFPPRPESRITPDSIIRFSSKDFIAQPKTNGSCAVLFLRGDGTYQLYNRHRGILHLQKDIQLERLQGESGYRVLCGEYLNKNKLGEHNTPFNHKFVIWDILVNNGDYLVGTTLFERLELLTTLFPCNSAVVNFKGDVECYDHLCCTKFNGIYRAPSYYDCDFEHLFYEIIKTDLYEGLVLKRGSGILEFGYNERNNTSWQVKVRKQTKNYSF